MKHTNRNYKLAIPCIVCLLFCLSCQNKFDEMLSDEQISSNLLTMGDIGGSIDPELLIGEWEFVKFAYTADGKKISNAITVLGGRLTIPIAPTPVEDDGSERWGLHCVNSMGFICSISDNLIDLSLRGSTYIYVLSPHIEYDLIYAFTNAYSFVINGNELIIHFKKVEDRNLLSNCTAIENKNLIIFKKR